MGLTQTKRGLHGASLLHRHLSARQELVATLFAVAANGRRRWSHGDQFQTQNGTMLRATFVVTMTKRRQRCCSTGRHCVYWTSFKRQQPQCWLLVLTPRTLRDAHLGLGGVRGRWRGGLGRPGGACLVPGRSGGRLAVGGAWLLRTCLFCVRVPCPSWCHERCLARGHLIFACRCVGEACATPEQHDRGEDPPKRRGHPALQQRDTQPVMLSNL